MFSRWLKREMSQGRHLCLCSSRGPSCTPYTHHALALVLGYHVNPLQKKGGIYLAKTRFSKTYQLKNEIQIGIYLGKPIGFPKIPLKNGQVFGGYGGMDRKISEDVRYGFPGVDRRGSEDFWRRFWRIVFEGLIPCPFIPSSTIVLLPITDHCFQAGFLGGLLGKDWDP